MTEARIMACSSASSLQKTLLLLLLLSCFWVVSNSTNEHDKRMLSKDQLDLPSTDEGSYGGMTSGGGGSGSPKRKWTPEEDAILVEYVKKQGKEKWKDVQKLTGLSRCRRSCRRRWTEQLDPDLKKGAFTEAEEKKIIELHARLGNQWSLIGKELKGRAGNDIRNYWSKRYRKCMQYGWALHPSDVLVPGSNENQRQTIGGFSTCEQQHNEILTNNVSGLQYVASSSSNVLSQGFGSRISDFIDPSLSSKQLLRCILNNNTDIDSFSVPCSHPPQETASMQSEISSPGNSNSFLDFVNNLFSDECSNSLETTPNDMVDSLGRSESMPPINGLESIQPSAENVATANVVQTEINPGPGFLRPDAQLESGWPVPNSELAQENKDMKKNALKAPGDDFSSDDQNQEPAEEL